MSTETKTTCPYCGVGCGVIATVADDSRVSIKGDPDHPPISGVSAPRARRWPKPSIWRSADDTHNPWRGRELG